MAELEKFFVNRREAALSLGVIRTYVGVPGGKPDWLKAPLYPQSSTSIQAALTNFGPRRELHQDDCGANKRSPQANAGAAIAVPPHASGVSLISLSSKWTEHRTMLFFTTLIALLRRISLWTLN